MGQKNSLLETASTVNYEVKRHIKVLSELNTLSYEDFQNCLKDLNELSRKCIDADGKQLVFAVKKGTDSTMMWKALVRIACVKVDPESRQIDSCKFLNLKEFLRVFQTFQAHVEVMASSEEQKRFSTSFLFDELELISSLEMDSSTCISSECCICLDRRSDILLPCAHAFCSPCIEQWNVTQKKCPICLEDLKSTDDTWVISELPGADEINDEICTELMNLSQIHN